MRRSRTPAAARHGLRSAVAPAIALACSLLAVRARAEGPRVALEYRAGPGCPGEEEFLRAVRSRTDRFELAGTGAGATIYRVELGGDAGDHAGRVPPSVGRLETVSPAGAVSVRELRGDTCPDVADAIALVMALGIDPKAVTAMTAVTAPGAPPGEPRPASVAPAPRAAPTPDLPPRPRPAASSASYRLRPSAGIGIGASSGLAPRVLPLPALFVGADFVPAPRRDGVALSLSLRLSAVTVSSRSAGLLSETATLGFTAGRLDACPLRAVLGPLEASACARAEAGVLRASGAGVLSPRTPSYPWFSLGAALRLGARVVGPLFVEIEGAVTFPLVREHFFFDDPQTTVFDVPPVAAAAGGALGVRFE